MLEHDVDLIPVTDGARTVGVVMMTDVFDNVSEYVLERGTK
jgi:predicted transcriptional regulator